MNNSNRFEELAQRLAVRTKELRAERPSRPALSLAGITSKSTVDPDQVLAAGTRGMDVIMREWHCRMIRNIRRRWGQTLQQIVDQACYGVVDIEQLSDEALLQLHKDMERAEECMKEGICFHDAGLIKSRYA